MAKGTAPTTLAWARRLRPEVAAAIVEVALASGAERMVITTTVVEEMEGVPEVKNVLAFAGVSLVANIHSRRTICACRENLPLISLTWDVGPASKHGEMAFYSPAHTSLPSGDIGADREGTEGNLALGSQIGGHFVLYQ